MNRIRAVVIAVFALAGLPALAETGASDPYYRTLLGTLPDGETATLEGWEGEMRTGIAGILAQGEDADSRAAAEQIMALLDAERIPIADAGELVGDWRVRSLQADALGAYGYQFFPARIFYEAQALVFDKDSGSQRHRGLMALAPEGHVLFAGAMYYSYEEPRLHSAHMAEGSDIDPAFDTLAEIHKLGEDHYLMAFAPQGVGPRLRLYEMRR